MLTLSPPMQMWLAGGTLVAAYALIFSEVMHRTSAAIVGAVFMVIIGMIGGFYSQEDAIAALDANTLLLLMGMMMLVVILRPTGGFDYLAIRIAKWSRGSPILLLVYLSAAVSLISLFLDNVTTVLIFAPLTVLITRILNINPLPFLMAEAMLSNIGGAATLVGDPPNLMIGSAASIDFTTFVLKMGPLIGIVWLFTIVLFLVFFRHYLKATGTGIVDLDERKAIRDPIALIKALVGLALVVILFFIHHWFHLYPAFVAFIGVAVVMAWVRPHPEPVFGKMQWSVLVFFAGLFVIVGGVEASGLLDLIGHALSRLAAEPGQLLATCLILMWVAALLSAIVDNIPFTVTMIPIVLGLESYNVNITPLWWALAIGVGLGGNGSHIGATANIICVAESERAGLPEARITPAFWLKMGLPIMLAGLVVASVLFVLFFSYLAVR